MKWDNLLEAHGDRRDLGNGKWDLVDELPPVSAFDSHALTKGIWAEYQKTEDINDAFDASRLALLKDSSCYDHLPELGEAELVEIERLSWEELARRGFDPDSPSDREVADISASLNRVWDYFQQGGT